MFVAALILVGFLIYKQFGDNGTTTSYSQPQQEEVKQNVVENTYQNNNVNNYIPTAEDARYISYRTYYNDNNGFSVDYPDTEFFKISANHENIELRNDNGKIHISVDSFYDYYGENLQESYNREVRENPNAPYKFLGKTFYTITYEEDGLIIFRKNIYDKENNKYIRLYISFPPEYKDYMTPIVEKIANSMKKYSPTVTNEKKFDEIAEKDYYQEGITIGSFLDKDVYTVEVQAMLYNTSGLRLVLVEAENGEYMLLENAYGYGSNLASDWKEYVDKGVGMETLIPIVHLTGNIYKNLIFPNKQEALNYANMKGLKLYQK